jgi:gentisate 1,2-dioxygenase
MVHPGTQTATNHAWIYFQQIEPGSRSGQHRHVAEELILVLEGKGYDVHDGERWNWQQGDLICIPTMTTHQHFSLGDSPALLFSASPSIYADLGLGGIEQFEDAPE